MNSDCCNNDRRHGKCRRRPFTYGNPALGTSEGFIYTLEEENDDERDDGLDSDSDESGEFLSAAINTRSGGVLYTVDEKWVDDDDEHDNNRETERHENDDDLFSLSSSFSLRHPSAQFAATVAMVHVPPEQVPEGLLHLARAYRPWIRHVRILVARASTRNEKDLEDIGGENDNMLLLKSMSQHSVAPQRHYIVLLELESAELADQMVEDLHHQPFTSLDETTLCYIYHVVALEEMTSCEQQTSSVIPQSGFSIQSSSSAAETSSSRELANSSNKLNDVALSKSTSSNPQHHCEDYKDNSVTQSETLSAASRPRAIPLEETNCPVCLDTLDPNSAVSGTSQSTTTTSILTTVCNHSFHLDCLLQCQDSPCPVCRYDHIGTDDHLLSKCHICGTTEQIYVCLICGVVSCGQVWSLPRLQSSSRTANTNTYEHAESTAAEAALQHSQDQGAAHQLDASSAKNMASPCSDDEDGSCQQKPAAVTPQTTVRTREPVSTSATAVPPPPVAHSHARQHYTDTLHAYALDTNTQHVWDFAGQGYVHRLLQNKDDLKLVESGDPSNTRAWNRSLDPGLSTQQETEQVHRKLEDMATDYYRLLKSQLEQQRMYYQGRLEDLRQEFAVQSNSSKTKPRRLLNRGGGVADEIATNILPLPPSELIVALKNERHSLSQRLILLQGRRNKVQDDVNFLQSLNESLESNAASLRSKVWEAQQERLQIQSMFEECLPPLQEKVTRLMLQLEESTTSATAAATLASSSSTN